MGSLLNRSIVETVGHTPLVRLNRMCAGLEATVAIKCEYFNPLGSVKDRIGRAMVEAAEREGRLGPDTLIVEDRPGFRGRRQRLPAGAHHARNDVL